MNSLIMRVQRSIEREAVCGNDSTEVVPDLATQRREMLNIRSALVFREGVPKVFRCLEPLQYGLTTFCAGEVW